MAHAVQITLAQITEVLAAAKGWTDVTPQISHTKERVFDWKVCDAPHIVIRVYTSVQVGTGITRPVGSDAIRVCSVNLTSNAGFISAKRVHRVEGWRDNLQKRVMSVLDEARKRLQKIHNDRAHRLVEQANLGAAHKQDLSAVLAKLNEAHANGIQRPKLRFEIDGQKVTIARVNMGQNLGKANITDGKPYGQSQWFGRIELDGTLRSGKVTNAAVTTLLDELAEDVVKTAVVHGQKTGRCCFCSRHLTTKESVTAGYGPVCAERWSLPWGHVDTAQFGAKPVVKLTAKSAG